MRPKIKELKYEDEIFPMDVMIEILSLLGVKELHTYKCVSKKYRSLISSADFMRLHGNKSRLRQGLAIFNPKSLTSYLINMENFAHVSVQTNKLPLDKGVINDLKLVGSCDGMICFHMKTLDRFFVYNITTGIGINIDETYTEKKARNIGYGFTYDSERDDYKIVSIVERQIIAFSFRTRSWKRLKDYPFKKFLYSPRKKRKVRSVTSNNTLHWLHKDLKGIFSIDNSTEAYFETPLPTLVGRPILLNLKGRLHLGSTKYICTGPRTICQLDLWLMLKYGDEYDSWIKLFDVEIDGLGFCARPIFFTSEKNKVLIEYQKMTVKKDSELKEYIWYDMITKTPCGDSNHTEKAGVIAELCHETLFNPKLLLNRLDC